MMTLLELMRYKNVIYFGGWARAVRAESGAGSA